MRFLGILVLAIAALLAPATAHATDYCVAPNTACGGTNVATLQQALDAADNGANADRVFLGAAVYMAPAAGGYLYNAPASPVEIVGAGTGATTLTAPAGATGVLSLDGGAGSAIHDLTVRLPASVPASAVGLTISDPAQRVAVTADATQANQHIGVQVREGGSFSDGSVALSTAMANVLSVQVAFGATGTAVSRTSITGRDGVSVQEPNIALERLHVTAGSAGVTAYHVGAVLRSSVIRPVGGAWAIMAFAQPGTPASIIADGVTIVGDGSPGSGGVAADEIGFAVGATATVRNSIIRGVESSLGRFADGGPASVIAQYSDYDPSAIREFGTGGGTVTPPPGALEPGANVNVDPAFADPASDFRLRPGSPVIDRGDPAAVNGLTFDGGPLIADGDGDGVARRDMGAFEAPAVSVAPPASPPPPAAPPSSRPDTLAPAITGLSLSNRTFRVDRRARAAAAKRGTRFRFTLSEAASVGFTIERRARGRRARYVRVGTFARSLRGGRASVAFSGRLRVRGRTRALSPGRYRATVRATDAARNASQPRRVTFRVVKR
jgi:hypothetical protein